MEQTLSHFTALTHEREEGQLFVLFASSLLKESMLVHGTRYDLLRPPGPLGDDYGHTWRREFDTGNEIPRIVAHKCIIEASIGKRIDQT
jgi:hypothetical protein